MAEYVRCTGQVSSSESSLKLCRCIFFLLPSLLTWFNNTVNDASQRSLGRDTPSVAVGMCI